MPNYKLDNELKSLSEYVYQNSKGEKPKNWINISKSKNSKTGFYAEAFLNGNDIVIAFRGTDTERGLRETQKDLVSDLKMGIGEMPPQIINAQNYYNKIKKDFPNQNIILTGHSLGGSLAQIIGSETGDNTVTFGAYGIKNILKTNKSADNITNYGNANDPIFIANIDNQMGKTYVMDDYESNQGSVYKTTGFNKNLSKQKHEIPYMGDLSKAVEYQGQNLQTEETLLINASIEKNIDMRDFDPNRIITNEEIGAMTNDEFKNNEEFINQQMKDGKIMEKAQAEEKVKSGDLVWVAPYTRNDGTEVKGYYRAK